MFNGCSFNSVKFNSVCFKESNIIEPIVSGGIRVRRRKYKVLQKQFFNIFGIKLLFKSEFLNIIGFILLSKHQDILISAKVLKDLEIYFALLGQTAYFTVTEKELIGFVKYLENQQIDIIAVTKFLNSINYTINGTVLSYTELYKELDGKKLLSFNNEIMINGIKDIRNILEALDLLDLGE